MGAGVWVLAAGFVVLTACGKTSSKDGAGGSLPDSTSGSAGAGGSGTTRSDGGDGGEGGDATTTASLTSQGVTTGASVCALPERQNCDGNCVNLRTSSEHCGSCGNACADGYECVIARCAPRVTCARAPVHYDAAELNPSGGVELDDGWLLAPGESLSLEHPFAGGPAVLLLTARGVDGEPRPHVSVTIGESMLAPLLLQASSQATYSLEHDGLAETQIVSITPTATGGTEQPSVVVQSLEIQDCLSLFGQCEGGGYYLSEIPACVPPVCSEPSDCSRDLPVPPFLGRCTDGACSFPSCTELTASGLPLYEEYTSPEISFRCFSYAELTDPLSNPRASTLANDPLDFECPAIEALTWQIDPFRGEGSCVQAPVCGPNMPEELGFDPSDAKCCYLVVAQCGP